MSTNHPMHAATREIAAVLFDADGVIQRSTRGWRSELIRLCNDPDRGDEFLTELFAAERPCFTGAVDFRPGLADVLARWGNIGTVDEALAIWTRIEPDPEMLDVVARLRARDVRVGLASNQQKLRAQYMSETLDYASRFDHLLYSCVLGHAKPNPQYFEQALMHLQLPGSAVLFFDDREANVAAARAVGLHAEVVSVDHGGAGMRGLLARYGLHVS
jgi:putative hydrolase of the HAD superfamily